jgi:hypothetical protein
VKIARDMMRPSKPADASIAPRTTTPTELRPVEKKIIMPDYRARTLGVVILSVMTNPIGR